MGYWVDKAVIKNAYTVETEALEPFCNGSDLSQVKSIREEDNENQSKKIKSKKQKAKSKKHKMNPQMKSWNLY